MTETDANGARVLAERLRRAVADAFAAEATPLPISFGVVSFPRHGRTQEQLLQHADDAMYTAKSLGRNRCAIHQPAGRRAATGAINAGRSHAVRIGPARMGGRAGAVA